MVFFENFFLLIISCISFNSLLFFDLWKSFMIFFLVFSGVLYLLVIFLIFFSIGCYLGLYNFIIYLLFFLYLLFGVGCLVGGGGYFGFRDERMISIVLLRMKVKEYMENYSLKEWFEILIVI